MEQNFQTSFIPKKPIVPERSVAPQPVGILLVLALFALFTVVLATGGIYFYKEVTKKKIDSMKDNLELAQNRFEPAKLAELQVLDQRLRAGGEVLANHTAVTPFFDALEAMTMKTVRFTSLSYTAGESMGMPSVVQMTGEAAGYRSIALQSDLFAQNKNFIDPVFSNLTLDPNGNVLFDLAFSVDASFLRYQQTLPQEF